MLYDNKRTLDTSKPYVRYFQELSRIPRRSFYEEQVEDWILAFAALHNFEWIQDDYGNIVVIKKATEGYEDVEPIVLQAHMDMVCVKKKGSSHDFARDPLDLYIDQDNCLRAHDTNLGCSDAVGLSYMFAILDSRKIKHPRLECVFTRAKEVHLEGAKRFDPRNITAKRIISLDGGNEKRAMICSAGGSNLRLTMPLVKKSMPMMYGYSLHVKGLLGGHSGREIDKGRANAIRVVCRVLGRMDELGHKIHFMDIQGGTAVNAIPRHMSCYFACKSHTGELLDIVSMVEDEMKNELGMSDPNLMIILQEEKDTLKYCTYEDSMRALRMMYCLPDGQLAWNNEINTVETSLNLGLASMQDDELILEIRIRALQESAILSVEQQIKFLTDLLGVKLEVLGRYPAWNYKKESKMLAYFNEVVQEKYGMPCELFGSHGGSECGIWQTYDKDMDIIGILSIGTHRYTTDEFLDLNRFNEGYDVLVKLLEIAK